MIFRFAVTVFRDRLHIIMKALNKKSIFSGAAFLALGAFTSKALGALYRIPLTNVLGGTGLGLYQMVFPVYALLLDFSGAAVPGAISKLIASEKEQDKERRAYAYLKSSIRLLLFFGLIGSTLMIVLSKPLSKLQGAPDAFLAYVFLSPAVFLVSLISCLRGYFQGLMNMIPTALSQVIEQVVKLVFGLFLANLFIYNTPKAVAGATFAITISEAVALLVLFILYLVRKKKLGLRFAFNNYEFKSQAKSIIKTTVPITLIGILLPFSQVIDSFLTVNLIGSYRGDATALYGIFGGAVMTVINLPVSICYGVSTVAIPAVSASKTQREVDKNSSKALLLTIAVALPCVIFVAVGAPFIINLLFRNLPQTEKAVAVNLLRITSPCILTLSTVQTSNAVLIGKGRLYTPVTSLFFGVLVKTALNILLLKIPSLNIYGGALALNACYFTVCLINLILIFNLKVKNASKRPCNRQVAS